jgi:hypothetical protein
LTWIYFASFYLNYQFQIVGSFWYLLAVERNDFCWKKACSENGYNKKFLYCGNQYMQGYSSWQNRSEAILTSQCSTDNDNPPFDYGIFTQALKSGIVSSNKFLSKYVYCLWWGLQNLRYLILLSLLIFISQFMWKHTKHSNTEIICSLVFDMPGLIKTWVVLAAHHSNTYYLNVFIYANKYLQPNHLIIGMNSILKYIRVYPICLNIIFT